MARSGAASCLLSLPSTADEMLLHINHHRMRGARLTQSLAGTFTASSSHGPQISSAAPGPHLRTSERSSHVTAPSLYLLASAPLHDASHSRTAVSTAPFSSEMSRLSARSPQLPHISAKQSSQCSQPLLVGRRARSSSSSSSRAAPHRPREPTLHPRPHSARLAAGASSDHRQTRGAPQVRRSQVLTAANELRSGLGLG